MGEHNDDLTERRQEADDAEAERAEAWALGRVARRLQRGRTVSPLEQVRSLGLLMSGAYPAQELHAQDENGEDVRKLSQRWYGWTTDEAKAEAARELGATVTTVTATDPRFSGWEISVTEVWTP